MWKMNALSCSKLYVVEQKIYEINRETQVKHLGE
jgi:hypothetical protein